MPLVRFTAKAYHNGQFVGPGEMLVVGDDEIGPHMVVIGGDQGEAPAIVIADQEAAAPPAIAEDALIGTAHAAPVAE